VPATGPQQLHRYLAELEESATDNSLEFCGATMKFYLQNIGDESVSQIEESVRLDNQGQLFELRVSTVVVRTEIELKLKPN